MSNNRNGLFNLTSNERLILNIYLNMYNQTVHDIDLLYQQVDLLYDNLNELRNIINIITGISRRTTSNQDTTQERQNNISRENLSDNFYLLDLARYLNSAHNDFNVRTERMNTSRRNINSNFINNNIRTNNNNNNNNTSTGTRIITDIIDNAFNSFYDNVPVIPSRNQIIFGTRTTSFSNIQEPLNNICPITLERFEDNSDVTTTT